MAPFEQLRFLLHITHSSGIARRYFVTNGFDGALTMLGLMMGFRISGGVAPSVMIAACMGAAIALGMSGLSSAYISEAAERRRELRELEEAMLVDLNASAHARAARLVPMLIALVNGMAPFLISLLIMAPLWLEYFGILVKPSPIDTAIIVAFLLIFLIGVFLARVSGGFWLWTGLRTVAIATVTSLLILLVGV
jgi:predicted membrane protein (TIGR00267 family)